jgi:ribosomal protein S18 acetylase RimI-like enzyme
VLLILSRIENSPHRAEVAKVLVQRTMRGRGIATRLLEAAEAGAIAQGRTLLVLDTVTGSAAERLYARLGWQTVGAIPGFALDVYGRPEPATFMFKQLSDAGASPTRSRAQARPSGRGPSTTPLGAGR